MAELSRPFPDIHVLFYIVNVLERGSISEENTGESCIWLRFLFPEKVVHDLVLNVCVFLLTALTVIFVSIEKTSILWLPKGKRL